MGFEDQREPVDPPGYVSEKEMNSEGYVHCKFGAL
jgi:hypothetical protein